MKIGLSQIIIGGDLNVGYINSKFSLTGSLSVTNTSDESITTKGGIKIESITSSIDKDTGALVVAGGVGISENLNVGGDVVVRVA